MVSFLDRTISGPRGEMVTESSRLKAQSREDKIMMWTACQCGDGRPREHTGILDSTRVENYGRKIVLIIFNTGD